MKRDSLFGVGSVTERSVRLWLRCPEGGGPLRLALEPEGGAEARAEGFEPGCTQETDWTASVTYPHDFAGAAALEPDTVYRYRIESEDGEALGQGSFRTAPESGNGADGFSFAFMSCHQPFDEDGGVHPEAAQMQRLLGPALEEHGVRYVLLMGDQMYSDHPKSRSLFEPDYFRTVARHAEESLLDCTEEEMLHHYHRRYREIWDQGGVTALQERVPTYWILDDHEIVDNWGASAEHGSRRWRRLGRAARRAFLHYQASHAVPGDGDPPASFHHHLAWGPTATFVTDMRSAHVVNEDPQAVFGDQQLEDLERFLADNEDREALFVVLTVPILPLPKKLVQSVAAVAGDGSDVEDRWESSTRVRDRDRFLRLLLEHQRRCPYQLVVLLSGDVHLGCALEVRWVEEEAPPFYQLISSGVTNVLGLTTGALLGLLAKALPMVELESPQLTAELVPGVEGDNPFAGLNFGVVDVGRSADGSPTARFRILTIPEDGDSAVVAFDSGELTVR